LSDFTLPAEVTVAVLEGGLELAAPRKFRMRWYQF